MRSTRVTGFTLVELMAVIALMAVLVTGAVFAFRAPLAMGRIHRDIDAIVLADRIARSETLRFHRADHLKFELNSHPDGATVERGVRRGQSTARVTPINSLAEVRMAGLPVRSDRVIIPIDAAGRSPTYALKFLHPDSQETWVVMAGGTGQPIVDLTLEQVDEVLNILQPPPAP